MSGTPLLQVEGISRSYGDHLAVDGVAFEVSSGETFGLLGPNGAGKTTTIHMLVGLLKPDTGQVRLGSDRAADNPADPQVRRLLGVAPQQLSLYGDLTARENLEFFGHLYGLSGAALRDRVDWALEFARLSDRQHDRIGTYSGGMKRRINIAVALIHEPRIVLLDEPTVGVDPQSRNHIFDCMEQLRAGGMTILYTTHYMEEAQRLCDRVAIMDHGRLLALDTVPRLIEQHGGASVVTGKWQHRPGEVEIPGAQPDRTFRFESDRPLDEVSGLTNRGVRFQTLKIAQPDLESVFLNLTGRHLRDS